MYEENPEPGDLRVKGTELMAATADDSDDKIRAAGHEVLKLLRERMNAAVVFVSKFMGGKRAIRAERLRT